MHESLIQRILVLTVHAHPSHYNRDIPLVQVLRSRGYQVTYVVPGAQFTTRQFASTNYPASVLQRQEFIEAGTVVLNSVRQFRTLMRRHDLLIAQMSREKTFEQIAADLGKFCIVHQNTGAADVQHERPDFVAIAGSWQKGRLMRERPLPDERVVVTGSVQFDRAWAPDVVNSTREAFCAKYALNPEKPILVWLPESPATHSAWYKDRYKQICRMVRESGKYNVIIKGHPSDYAGHKRESAYDDVSSPSWVQLVPDVPACSEEDAYLCFKHCDLGLTITSTVFMDFALFKKPVLIVDFQEGCLPVGRENEPLPTQRFRGFGLQRLYIHPETKRITMQNPAECRGAECYLEYSGDDASTYLYFAGAECSLNELPAILSKGDFRLADDSAYDEIVRMCCLANDGKSASRIADLVERLNVAGRLPASTSEKAPRPLRKIYRQVRDVLCGL